MPLFAKLFAAIGGGIFSLIAALVGAKLAARLVAVASLAAIYISCVVYYTRMITPWLEGVFATAYGQFLGLLFPPISGTVIAGLVGYWTCVAGLKYTSSLTKMAFG